MASPPSAILGDSLQIPPTPHKASPISNELQFHTGLAVDVSPDSPLDPRAIILLEKLGAQYIAGTIHEYKISPGVYRRVLDTLEAEDNELWGFVQEELRHEIYDDEKIIILMSSIIHGGTSSLLCKEIEKAYQSLLDDPYCSSETKSMIDNIIQLDDSKVRVEGKWSRVNKFHPDHQWRLKKANVTGLVLEIAYSQSFKDVKEKALKYIVGSQFQTRMVVALEVSMEPGIGLSVWKSKLASVEGKEGLLWTVHTVMEQKQIESKDGRPVEGHLSIELGCFGPLWAVKKFFPGADVRREIHISYDSIVRLVKQARKMEKTFNDRSDGQPSDERSATEPGDTITIVDGAEYED